MGASKNQKQAISSPIEEVSSTALVPPGAVATSDGVQGTYSDPAKVDWEKAFRVLAASYGGQLLSSDVHLFAKRSLERFKVEPEAVSLFLKLVAANRSDFVRDFMG